MATSLLSPKFILCENTNVLLFGKGNLFDTYFVGDQITLGMSVI